jgi:uncharacterized protein YhbP (UPF0306 family)
MPQLPQQVLDYLEAEKTVTLATASPDGTPHASTFMYVNDGPSLYFWARPSSTTAQHVQQNPRVSFAIDEYVADWNKAKGIQGRGRCAPLPGDELVNVLGRFGDKFPSPSSGASTANIAFYKVSPEELHFIDNAGANIHLGEEEFGIEFHRERVLGD